MIGVTHAVAAGSAGVQATSMVCSGLTAPGAGIGAHSVELHKVLPVLQRVTTQSARHEMHVTNDHYDFEITCGKDTLIIFKIGCL